jgi:DNA modification methylase
MSCKIIHGDCLGVMKSMESNSIDSILTDPPYGLKFMGKKWDYGIPSVDVWKESRRICKPGAMMLCFGGSRTYHRLTCSIEDAGWEIRDCIMWIYGSGFPKSMNISKAIDKSNGKENIIGYIADRWTGKGNSLNFSTDRPQEKCKITAPNSNMAKIFSGYGTALKPAYEPIIMCMKPIEGTYAQNVEKCGVGGINIDACRIGYEKGRWPANIILDEDSGKILDEQSNGASRFFYCAKASSKERNEGLENLPLKEISGCYGKFSGDGRGRQTEHTPSKNNHPTVKPLKLLEYLLKLIKPPSPDSIILDPFCGSGSTIVACKNLGIKCIGIEKEKEYVEISQARVDSVISFFALSDKNFFEPEKSDV